MNYFYLLKLQYLGYRYHGYALQPEVKTVQKMLEKTIRFVLGDVPFKTLASGRTDAMVSAEEAFVELFCDQALDLESFLKDMNLNLPMDIRLLSVEPVDDKFNVIQAPKQKTYRYYFAFGQKMDPRAAPFISSFPFDLNLEEMKAGAKFFEGAHDFRNYCMQPKESTQSRRTILKSQVMRNTDLTASFFPSETWLFEVQGGGFMRNQIRLMMGQLLLLGQGKTTLDRLKASLSLHDPDYEAYVAPASGLTLHRIEF